MILEPIHLSADEKEAFISYLREKGYAETTIKRLVNGLTLKNARTKHSRSYANKARRKLKEFWRDTCGI